MKKLTFLLTLCTLFFMGCSDNQSFTLKGKVSELASDTILVYYQVPEYKLDTLIAEKGSFEYTIHPDTFTMFSLVLTNDQMIPVFANKGEEVVWTGSSDSLIIKGKGENKLMNDILKIYRQIPQDSIVLYTDSITYYTDSLLKANPLSFTNIYLIDHYYHLRDSIDYITFDEQINLLGGEVRDTYHILDLQSRIEDRKNRRKSDFLFTLNVEDQFKRHINWNRLKDTYVLLDFWASWHSKSQAQEDTLATVIKALKKKPFVAISISLDMDKEEWKKNIAQRDTTQWYQSCDFTGWNHQLVKQLFIDSIPASFLINPRKEIIERDIEGQQLVKKVKQLIKEDKEKKRKERKKKR